MRDLSGETDDILVKASVDPLWACRGLVSEGMGKGHMHVDFFTTCPRVRAHKRTQHWRTRKDLWFSLPGPPLAPLQSGCKDQLQSRCRVGNMTPGYWCGSGEGVCMLVGGWGGGSQVKYKVLTLEGSNSSSTIAGNAQERFELKVSCSLIVGSFLWPHCYAVDQETCLIYISVGHL